jgi:chloramphenicol-sensitive protein RarD
MKESRERGVGVAYALAACVWWGGAVFYFKAVAHVQAAEVIAHRTVWTAVLMVAGLALSGRLRTAVRAVCDGRRLALLTLTALLIAVSWYSNVWAVSHDRVLEASLGYYIMPHVNVLLGCIFLRERLRRWQTVCVLLALVGVVILGVSYGQVPAVALVMAMTFGLYGLLRKKVSVDGTVGLAAESIILIPVALIYGSFLYRRDQLSFAHIDLTTDLLLVAAGVITALPLIWYVNAAKRLPLTTLGLMMYIVPSITFLAAVFGFDEPFGMVQLVSFCFIWTALLIYSLESVWWARTVNTGEAAVRHKSPANFLASTSSGASASGLQQKGGGSKV